MKQVKYQNINTFEHQPLLMHAAKLRFRLLLSINKNITKIVRPKYQPDSGV
jgi:hypothetical protein